MTMRRKIMSWDKINLGDVVQGVWDNYYYLVVSIDKARQVKIICIEEAYRDREDKYEVWNEATILICYSKIYNVFENQAKLKEKRKCLTATAR